MIGQKYYNETLEKLETLNKERKQIENDIRVHEGLLVGWEERLKESFLIKDSDLLIDMPQHFVVRFKRNNVNMISMKWISGETKIFRESLLSNIED